MAIINGCILWLQVLEICVIVDGVQVVCQHSVAELEVRLQDKNNMNFYTT